jgi:hypothetical protein
MQFNKIFPTKILIGVTVALTIFFGAHAATLVAQPYTTRAGERTPAPQTSDSTCQAVLGALHKTENQSPLRWFLRATNATSSTTGSGL